jgi:beta-galactosidase
MFQLCNEIPNDDIDDRNPNNLGIGKKDGIFPQYLAEKYRSVESLNRCYGADFKLIENVEPHMLEKENKLLAENDHLEFYYGYYYPAYFQFLKNILQQNGIDTYLTHNAYNPRAISLHYQNKRKNPWLNIGVDCYYSLSGRIGIREATYFCEYGAEYCRRFLHNVPWVVEQECGYWHDYPAVYGPELYIWNIWTAAAGYRGFNMYLFASGINRRGMGFYGTDHNWQAPLDENGEKREHYEAICRSLKDIRRDETVFLADQRYDIAFGIKNAPGLIWRNIAKVADGAYFALKTAGYTPIICDFEAVPLEELVVYPYLWIVTDEYMNEDVQKKLCSYMEAGGRLILNGRIPHKDYMEDPCTILMEKLSIHAEPCSMGDDDQEKMILDGKEYYIGKTVQPIQVPQKSVLACDINNNPCAALIHFGKGFACLLPFEIKILFHSTALAIADILTQFGARPSIEGAKLLRIIPKEGGKSVALNIHPVRVSEMIMIDGIPYDISLGPHSYCIVTEKAKEIHDERISII